MPCVPGVSRSRAPRVVSSCSVCRGLVPGRAQQSHSKPSSGRIRPSRPAGPAVTRI